MQQSAYNNESNNYVYYCFEAVGSAWRCNAKMCDERLTKKHFRQKVGEVPAAHASKRHALKHLYLKGGQSDICWLCGSGELSRVWYERRWRKKESRGKVTALPELSGTFHSKQQHLGSSHKKFRKSRRSDWIRFLKGSRLSWSHDLCRLLSQLVVTSLVYSREKLILKPWSVLNMTSTTVLLRQSGK